jgi:hypothetical protein
MLSLPGILGQVSGARVAKGSSQPRSLGFLRAGYRVLQLTSERTRTTDSRSVCLGVEGSLLLGWLSCKLESNWA